MPHNRFSQLVRCPDMVLLKIVGRGEAGKADKPTQYIPRWLGGQIQGIQGRKL